MSDYSILEDEWPRVCGALLEWLDDANFAPDGTARRSLADMRNAAAPSASPVCYRDQMA